MKPQIPIIPGMDLPVTEIAKNQSEYITLPAYIDSEGTVLTRWKLTFKERLVLLWKGDLYHWQMAFHMSMQPIMMDVYKPQLTKEAR